MPDTSIKSDLNQIDQKLDKISHALAGVGEVSRGLHIMSNSMGQLSEGLKTALDLIEEESMGQRDNIMTSTTRLEGKIDGVHALVNSMYTASLEAQEVVLQQLVDLMTADLERLGTDYGEGFQERRNATIEQLKHLRTVLAGRKVATDIATDKIDPKE